MNKCVLFDGQYHKQLLPLTFTRPVAQLRIGIYTIQEKWSNQLGFDVGVRTKDYLAKKYNSIEESVELGISAALLPNKNLSKSILGLKEQTILIKEGVVLAIKPLPANDDKIEENLEGYNVIEYKGDVSTVEYPHHIFQLNGQEIINDLTFLNLDNLKTDDYGDGNLLIGDEIYIEDGATINGATLNSDEGPIYIQKGTEIMEGSNIRGPFVLMNDSTIKMGAKIYGPTTIGPNCKVGGEVGNSVFLGFANKAHDGYLGNSVIGEWCNLGADTNTSNLKNNYGEVSSYNYAEDAFIGTGTQYCGTIMGDHSKSSINTMFNTGTVVGVFANIFDAGFPPKFIPSFSWGGREDSDVFDFEKAKQLAEIVMKRRNLDFSKDEESILYHIFKETIVE